MNKQLPYRRILLKLSGESLMGTQSFGIQQEACERLAKVLQQMHKEGFQVAVVIGGGNIFRGIQLKEGGMERTPADQIGMLATIMNAIALQQSLNVLGCRSAVMSALDCPKAVESYNWSKSLDYLNSGIVLIFAGGTGNPYFTTDTAAALRASEIHADILLKATKVDGIYSKDPLKYQDAIKYETLNYSQMLSENLGVMDATSVALCRQNQIPIFVFNMQLLEKKALSAILSLPMQGTLVKGS